MREFVGRESLARRKKDQEARKAAAQTNLENKKYRITYKKNLEGEVIVSNSIRGWSQLQQILTHYQKDGYIIINRGY